MITLKQALTDAGFKWQTGYLIVARLGETCRAVMHDDPILDAALELHAAEGDLLFLGVDDKAIFVRQHTECDCDVGRIDVRFPGETRSVFSAYEGSNRELPDFGP